MENLIFSIENTWEIIKTKLNRKNETTIIGIGGGECTGKSHVSQLLKDIAAEESYKVEIIPLDGYLKYARAERIAISKEMSLPDAIYFEIGDHPECFDIERLVEDLNNLKKDKRLLNPPIYDYSLGKVVRSQTPLIVDSKTIVIVEGIFALLDSLVPLFDFAIFLKTDPIITKERYILRHLDRKTDSQKNIITKFEHKVVPAYNALIEPTQENANVVLLNNSHED